MKKESVKQAFLRRKKKLPLKTVYYLSFLFFMIPTIAIYIFFQKYILAGVAAGAVKE